MKHLPRILILAGVVLAALGAAGFHDPVEQLRRGEKRLADEAAETGKRLQGLLEDLAAAAGREPPSLEGAAPWLEDLGRAVGPGEEEAARLERLRELAGHYDLARDLVERRQRLLREVATVRERLADLGEAESPGRERGAGLLFLLGLAALGAGGFLGRRRRMQAGDSVVRGVAGELADLRALLEQALEGLGRLEQDGRSLSAEALRERIDEIQMGPFLEISDSSEEWMLRLGFASYARIWDGFAAAERLAARAWSMATDGYPEEARRELPRARAGLERALQALSRVETAALG